MAGNSETEGAFGRPFAMNALLMPGTLLYMVEYIREHKPRTVKSYLVTDSPGKVSVSLEFRWWVRFIPSLKLKTIYRIYTLLSECVPVSVFLVVYEQ